MLGESLGKGTFPVSGGTSNEHTLCLVQETLGKFLTHMIISEGQLRDRANHSNLPTIGKRGLRDDNAKITELSNGRSLPIDLNKSISSHATGFHNFFRHVAKILPK